jgi:DNA-binding LacI/PurR family transcriptional regulator
MRGKYIDIVRVLESRIHGGDYALSSLPGERRIAEEFGVSHMTARRAVKHLVDLGLLGRPAGRFTSAQATPKESSPVRIACVIPAFPSQSMHQCCLAVAKAVAARQGVARVVAYTHEEDPVIQKSLVGEFSGVFILPPHNPSKLLLDLMTRHRHRLVTLWQNLTDRGIPCIDNDPLDGVSKLIELLADQGHRRIDCFNTQPDDSVVRDRITAWRNTLKRLGLGGDLYDLPVEPFGESGLAARDHARRLFRTHRITGTATFCVTTVAAIGFCRALHELNVQVGKHHSVCGFGDSFAAQLNAPSVTVAESTDATPFINQGLDWILSGGKASLKSLLLQPDQAQLWIGESTGPHVPPGH